MFDENFYIKFVGSGSPFEPRHGNSAAIVRHRGKNWLLDCGHTVFPRLMALGLVDQIDAVLVTHLHDDHGGSLSSMLLYQDIVLRRGPIPIYVPDQAHADTLAGFFAYTMGRLEGRAEFRMISEAEGVGYLDTFGKHVPDLQTYGYYFEDGNRSIVFSGDNGDADHLVQLVDALQLPNPIIFHDTFFYGKVHVHAHYQDLMRLSTRYPIYGYHCDPVTAPADSTLPLVADFPELNY